MKEFNRKLLSIALPITIQNLISMSLNLVDNLMIGQLGSAAIAAVGLVNQINFVLILFLFGASSGTGVFISQYWGNRDLKNIGKTISHVLKITYVGGFVFFMLLFFFPQQIISFFSRDITVVTAGVAYSKIISFTTFLIPFTFVMAMALRTIEKPKIPMYISFVVLAFNTVGNYLLIFGVGPFPEMGVKGAAIATLLSRIIEFFLYLYVLLKPVTALTISRHEFLDFDTVLFRKLMVVALPVIVNELLWSVGMTTYSFIMARIGTEALTVKNIVSTLESFGFIIFGGMSAATVVMVGSELGKKNYEKAFKNAIKLLNLMVVIGVITGIGIILLSRFLIRMYNVEEVIKSTVVMVMIIVGLAQPVKMFNGLNIVGVLRSGGDTKTAMFLELFSLWGIGIPLVALSGIVLKWPLPFVFLMMLPEELFKASLGMLRVHSRKWLRNVID
ncbi:MATE family efflux transporter [Kosmotoga olearia]|uniref:Multidrug-efflux transporter n=1 Tax=Kosmotoga olearia (strain ATCC BAA-1733 / DSM 21960 / TBF 19.5.1) TaxID=521045 RepID=C5CDS4_KOSOT|nr:MATE family efflux transporter [Kosmotoga olearia]ACR79093.1 MATE efflux family protein [Kosmotoga olearia TBF 19.5.1]